jgi:hypothetical protein
MVVNDLGVNFQARSGKFGNKWGDGIHKCQFCKGFFQEREGVAAQASGGIHAERGDDRPEAAAKGAYLVSFSLWRCSHAPQKSQRVTGSVRSTLRYVGAAGFATATSRNALRCVCVCVCVCVCL